MYSYQTLYAASYRVRIIYIQLNIILLRVCPTLLVVFLLYTDKLQKPVGHIHYYFSRFTPSLAPLQRRCAESNSKDLHRQHIYHTFHKYYPYDIISHLHTQLGTKEHYAQLFLLILISIFGHLLQSYIDSIASHTMPCI